ncbi:MAG: hypothetical protein NTU94_12155 [Planctomycetota bacterium]|nr:hypothetical protein [Planctomycetota bacterium]
MQRFSDYLAEVHPRIQYLEEIAVARDYIPWRRQAGVFAMLTRLSSR